jgi:hypothetical protein
MGDKKEDKLFFEALENGFIEESYSITQELSSSTFMLPIESKDNNTDCEMIPKTIKDFLISKVIPNKNFFSENSLYCIKTESDGNCLLNAVSLSLWGCHDEKYFLRQFLSLTISSIEFSDSFLSLFIAEESLADEVLGQEGARDTSQLKEEFTRAVNDTIQNGK